MASLKQKLEQAAFELAEAKATVNVKQQAFDALYRQVASGAKSRRAPTSSVILDSPNGATNGVASEDELTMTDQIMSVLVSDRNKAWNYAEIHTAVPNVPVSSIRALLFRLKRHGKAEKAGRGKWKILRFSRMGESGGRKA